MKTFYQWLSEQDVTVALADELEKIAKGGGEPDAKVDAMRNATNTAMKDAEQTGKADELAGVAKTQSELGEDPKKMARKKSRKKSKKK